MGCQCNEEHLCPTWLECDHAVFIYFWVGSQHWLKQCPNLLEENSQHICLSSQWYICAGDVQRENKAHWKERARELQPCDWKHQGGGPLHLSESQSKWKGIQFPQRLCQHCSVRWALQWWPSLCEILAPWRKSHQSIFFILISKCLLLTQSELQCMTGLTHSLAFVLFTEAIPQWTIIIICVAVCVAAILLAICLAGGIFWRLKRKR